MLLSRCSSPRPAAGASYTPILIFAGIVGLSVVFFLLITWPARQQRRLQAQQTPPVAEAPASAETNASAPEPAAAEPPARKESQPAPPPTESASSPSSSVPSSSPRTVVQTVARHLAQGQWDQLQALLGAALTEEKARQLHALFGPGRLAVPQPPRLREIGEVGPLNRWSVLLENTSPPPAPEASSYVPGTPGADLALELDLGRQPDRGWQVEALHFTPALQQRAAGWDGLPAAVPPLALTDPLAVTEHFLQAVLRQNYDMARAVTDEEAVSREKVAGLCILFEEGAYQLAAQRPLSATATGPNHTWVIVKVSPGPDAALPGMVDSDFGLELQRQANGTWRVTGVNFSNLLSAYMQAEGANEGVAYTPIVKNPSGGESLVVYFGFDDAELTPRARRQLDIVAQLLRGDTNRLLRLTGHADALGRDDYNRRLSAARAYAVREYLLSLGVPARQIVTEGLGALRPLAANTRPDGSDNPEGRSKNRRTEIFLDF